MATKTEKEGKEAASYEAALGGRKTKQLSTAFPPIWICEDDDAGAFIIGAFQGSQEVTPKGMKEFTSFNVALDQWKGRFMRSKKEYEPTRGEIVSVSGDILGRALENVKPQTVVGIKFLGLGEKKGKRSAPKLYEVNEILP